MKKLIIIAFISWIGIIGISSQAQEKNKTPISKEEFRTKQQAFITKEADLTKEEATIFFPVYFELQDKKKKINDKVWRYIKKGKDPKTTEEQYEEIIEEVLDGHIEADELEKSYYYKFRKLLSAKKLYKVQHAEMKFHRELLKNMKKKNEPKKN